MPLGCNGPQETAGGWTDGACADGLASEGFRFTAVGSQCDGGWLYTGSGHAGGWSAQNVSLWSVSSGTKIAGPTLVLTPGDINSVAAFSWLLPVALTPGQDYVICIEKGAGNCYAFKSTGVPSTSLYTGVQGVTASGTGTLPSTASGVMPGIEPRVCGAACAYGTQANPDAVYYELITDGLIDLVVGAALAGTANGYLIPYVETALAAIEGSIFIAPDCSTMPGAGPTLDFPNLSTLSTATLDAWFQNAAWRFFCECVPAPPGSSAPVLPDAPPIIPPTTVVPVQPAPLCDNADLCSYLAAMKAQLQAITAQISYLRTDVRLIQRQHVPFAYVPGTLHSGLTAAGQFAVQGILGLAVEVTSVPGASGEEIGDPIARFGLGWVTTGTADGWRRSVPIRHNPMWVDAEPDDTLVGYSLEPLVVATIQEFVREP